MLDIAKQAEATAAEDDGTFVHLMDLDDNLLYYTEGESGAERPVGIEVAGAHSRRFREIENKHRKRRIKVRDLTGAKLHDDSIEKVAYCTLAWQGIADSGTPVPLTLSNARELYTQLPWVLEQVTEAMNDHQRFTKSE
jgi:hypothetical protein